MGYAKYVGRIGGLAVALGVGVAIATTPGVAWAGPDGGGTDTSTSDTSTTSDTTGISDTTGSKTTGSPDPASGSDAGQGSTGSGEAGASVTSPPEMNSDSSGGQISSTTPGSAGAAVP